MGLAFFALLCVSIVVVMTLVIGVRVGALAWNRVWAATGLFAGLGLFAIHVIFDASMYFFLPVLGSLFVGAGIATAYGSLFLPWLDPTNRPLPSGDDGSVLSSRLIDELDDTRPTRPDWLNTFALAVPGLGLSYLSLFEFAGSIPLIVGIASLAGPLLAATGLLRRRRRADQIEAELALGLLPESAPLEGPAVVESA